MARGLTRRPASRVARFADTAAAYLKFFTPRYGTRHGLVSGTTGSGKSEFLNLLIFIAIECGYIVPVVLDPQEGQSLPYWRDRCLYAPGRGECLDMLRGLHAGMLDRSRYLASLEMGRRRGADEGHGLLRPPDDGAAHRPDHLRRGAHAAVGR